MASRNLKSEIRSYDNVHEHAAERDDILSKQKKQAIDRSVNHFDEWIWDICWEVGKLLAQYSSDK